jgi:hypothetical protein
VHPGRFCPRTTPRAGWARLATSPVSTTSAANGMTIGLVVVASFAVCTAELPPATMSSTCKPDQLCCQRWEAIWLPRGPPVLDSNVLALDPAKLAQALPEGCHARCAIRRRFWRSL